MDVVADFPADAQAAEPVQQRDGLFGDPPVHAESRTVPGAAPGDLGLDSLGTHEIAILVVVVGAVGVQLARSPARAASPSPHRRNRLDQWHQLGDVVPLATGQGSGQWQAATFHRLYEDQKLDRLEALRQMTVLYREHMHANEPVHDWPVASL